jgi:uncharacterized membrane protein
MGGHHPSLQRKESLASWHEHFLLYESNFGRYALHYKVYGRKIMEPRHHVLAAYRHRLSILGVLVLSTLASLSLLFIRWMGGGHLAYRWLIWDLFLAWIPLWLAIGIYALHLRGSRNRPMLLSLGLGWLLFFPNAPYLLTEFVHLGRRHDGLWWCDLLMTIGFASNGLTLGLLSLFIVQKVAQDRIGTRRAAWIAATSLALGSYGIALGRFQRFNSWDVIRHPFALAARVADQFIHPMAYPTLFASAALLFGFLSLAYLGFRVMVSVNEDDAASCGC